MDLKRLLMLKGLTQIELSKKLGVNHSLISLQICKHRLLPERHIAKFCEALGLTKEQLVSSMNEHEQEKECPNLNKETHVSDDDLTGDKYVR